MYGDTSVMRKRAGDLREQGVDIAVTADHLVARSDAISWTGRAADAMRARVRERATHLREAAALHETAADSLTRHVGEVDRLKESIAGVQQRAESLVADARTRVARLDADAADPAGEVRVSPSGADETLAAFIAPVPGHKDWLTVNLPGL
jgi:hypothetical protein